MIVILIIVILFVSITVAICPKPPASRPQCSASVHAMAMFAGYADDLGDDDFGIAMFAVRPEPGMAPGSGDGSADGNVSDSGAVLAPWPWYGSDKDKALAIGALHPVCPMCRAQYDTIGVYYGSKCRDMTGFGHAPGGKPGRNRHACVGFLWRAPGWKGAPRAPCVIHFV